MKIKYKSKVVRAVSKSRPKSVREIVLKSADDVPGLINGIQADSSYEWNIARSLWTLGWDTFDYQYSIYGGRNVRGGLVLDFVVPTRPAETVISVIGEYWHRDPDKEKINEIRIKSRLGHQVRVLRPGTPDCSTYDLALSWTFKNIGRA